MRAILAEIKQRQNRLKTGSARPSDAGSDAAAAADDADAPDGAAAAAAAAPAAPADDDDQVVVMGSMFQEAPLYFPRESTPQASTGKTNVGS